MKYLIVLALISCASCTPVNQKSSAMVPHAIRLLPGDDLKNSIQALVTEKKIKAGYIATCAGSLTTYALRFANQPTVHSASGHFEIVSLTGTVSDNGSHIDISVSDSIGNTIGGHLAEGNIVYTTAEIVIIELPNHVFTREKDGSTPWEELKIKKLSE